MLWFNTAFCCVLSEENGVMAPPPKSAEMANFACEFGKSDHQPIPSRGLSKATSRPRLASMPSPTFVRLLVTSELKESSEGFKLSMALEVDGTLEQELEFVGIQRVTIAV